MTTIDELLNALRNPNKIAKGGLINNKETWKRITECDSFSELGLEPNELTNFLNDWIKQNPYNNI